jgi:hypothetical protein
VPTEHPLGGAVVNAAVSKASDPLAFLGDLLSNAWPTPEWRLSTPDLIAGKLFVLKLGITAAARGGCLADMGRARQ